MSYNLVMTTMTFRLRKEARARLAAKAASLDMTESELLREIIERELQDTPIGARIGRLKGVLSLKKSAPEWRAAIRKRNWRS